MDQIPQDIKDVKHLENTPVAKTASNTLLVIGLVIGIFGLLAIVSYFFFIKTYSAKMEERKENALLYDDPNQKNILGEQITSLPDLEIGANKDLNKQPTPNQQQQAQQQQQRQAAQAPQAQAHAPASDLPPTASPTPVPDNIYMNKDKTFQVDNQKWAKQPTKTDGDTTTDTFKSSDGTYVLRLSFSTKKYDSIDAYLDTNPRGRKPPSSSTYTMNGKDGKKTEKFTINADGTTYETIGAYVEPKEGDGMISIELDSTSLDVNNSGLDDTFKKITDTFTFVAKN